MDFGMTTLYGNLAWQFSEYDVIHSCQNMDPNGQFFTGCGKPERFCDGPVADWGGKWDPCADDGDGLWIGPFDWDFSPSRVNPFGDAGVWLDKDGHSEWGPRATYENGFAEWNRRIGQWVGEFTIVKNCTYTPPGGPWLSPAGGPC